jgi:2-amino-4-hydroxy-6-hydroxymethyldihydropteridine diphosphokinase
MHTAYIAMGANIDSPAGPPQATLAAAARALEMLGRLPHRSSLYSTEPVGMADQPRFVNAVVALETALSPRRLLTALLALEHEFGRDRSAGIANGPRTLDLDILLYDDLIVDEPASPHLEIPHPRLAERAFVLVPLAEIAPDIIDPRSGRSIATLLEDLRSPSPDAPEQVVRLEDEAWVLG